MRRCRLEGWRPEGVPDAAPDSPAWLWAHRVQAGCALELPRHAGLDVLGVVLDGGVRVVGDDEALPRPGASAPGRPIAGTWGAFRAPGAGVRVHADYGATVVVAVVSTEGSARAAVARARAKRLAIRWRQRPGTIEVTSLALAPDLAWGGGAHHARIAFGGESARSGSLEVLLASKDAAIAPHVHEGSWEHVAVLSGAGTLKRGDEKVRIMAGRVIHIERGVRHGFTPSGASPLLAVQIYTPSGPEQRFASLAATAAGAQNLQK